MVERVLLNKKFVASSRSILSNYPLQAQVESIIGFSKIED
jgi:hypothetical protein